MGYLLSYYGEGDSNKKENNKIENNKIQSNKEVKQGVFMEQELSQKELMSKIKNQIASYFMKSVRATIICNIVDINDIDIIN